ASATAPAIAISRRPVLVPLTPCIPVGPLLRAVPGVDFYSRSRRSTLVVRTALRQRRRRHRDDAETLPDRLALRTQGVGVRGAGVGQGLQGQRLLVAVAELARESEAALEMRCRPRGAAGLHERVPEQALGCGADGRGGGPSGDALCYPL